ncbi:MAG: helix-turn-helix transcriptional regulator, partial [Muribaculaceae bacterium]|nr:helix-turn-helix transcriptional regulator [Muribaculaceae bacterium]
MLNKKIIESIFAELNESANKEWRNDRLLNLMSFEDLDDDEVRVVFAMGEDDVTIYDCVFAPDGYEYHRQGSGSNEGDAESVMQILMNQYDSAHYFVLDQVEEDKWKLTDEANGISVTWEVRKFNETQQFDTSGFDLQRWGAESAQIIATIIRRMTDWLADNHRELVEELNDRQLFGVKMSRLRKSKLLSIRELAERTDLATNTILNIEKGKFSPRLEIVERILSVLGAHLEIV